MSNPKKNKSKRLSKGANKRRVRYSNTNIIMLAMGSIKRIYNKRILGNETSKESEY